MCVCVCVRERERDRESEGEGAEDGGGCVSQKVLNTIPAVLEGRLPSRKRQNKYGTLSKEREREREQRERERERTERERESSVFTEPNLHEGSTTAYCCHKSKLF